MSFAPHGSPQPPRPRRSSRGVVIGLAAAVVLLVLIVAAALLADRVRGGTSLADIGRGGCFSTSKSRSGDKATKVDCTRSHTDEVAGILGFPDADGPYPGKGGILGLGTKECEQLVADFYGEKERAPTTQVVVVGPDETAWNKGVRTVVCSLRETTGASRTGSFLDS